MIGAPEVVIVAVLLVSLAAVAYPASRICTRVGFSPAIGLLAVVPMANLVLLWYVASAPWPIDGDRMRRDG